VWGVAPIVTGVVVSLAVVAAACHPPDAPTVPAPVPDPEAARDPINLADPAALHASAEGVLRELVAALPARPRARVEGVTFVRDSALGEVNAYATCGAAGPIVAVSDGLLVVAAHLAMGTATDERFETDRARAYLGWLAEHGLAPPPVSFYPAAYHGDRYKLRRQREVFEEQLAFVLGHELAHHYLGHLPCSRGNALEELGRVAADRVPAFNQLAEHAADTAAVKNLLAAGRQRDGYAWTEDGALLVIAAFHHRRPATARDVFRAFERTHPFPHLRAPAVVLAAELWHDSGGILPP